MLQFESISVIVIMDCIFCKYTDFLYTPQRVVKLLTFYGLIEPVSIKNTQNGEHGTIMQKNIHF